MSKSHERRSGDLPEALETELVSMLRAGNKIQAIKRLRDATGCGLAEAKARIEALAGQRQIGSANPTGCGTAVLLLLVLLSCGAMVWNRL